MNAEYEPDAKTWDPWSPIPDQYNLGVDLTGGQVQQGYANKVALHWENAFGDQRSLTYQQLDQLSTRLAWSLTDLGILRGDRVFLRLR